MKNLFVTFTLLGMMTAGAQAQDSGDTGPLRWEFNTANSTLTVSGQGVMPDYPDYSSPWYYLRASIAHVEIGNGVASIGKNAFESCPNMISVSMPNSLLTIGMYAFFDCTDLTSITLPENVTSIGNYAFMGCTGLISVTLPESVTSIGYGAFHHCTSLTSITIPENVTSIGLVAFYDCSNLQTVNYNAMNCSLGSNNSLFNNDTAFTTLHIGNRVKNIPDYAFYNCSGLTSVTIPDSVTSIGAGAFMGSGLTSVTLGNSVESIGNYAFALCAGLTTITSHAVTPPVCGNSNVFASVPSTVPVYIPCLAWDDYMSAAGWSSFINYNGYVDSAYYSAVKCYDVPYTDDNFTEPIYSAGIYYATLANSAGCDSVVCLTLTDGGYIPVAHYAASLCYGETYSDDHFTNLTQSGSYYDTLQNINGCDSIVCLTLSVLLHGTTGSLSWAICDSTLIISGSGAMPDYPSYGSPWYYDSIVHVEIGSGVTAIGKNAFDRCSSMTSVSIPNSVQSIGIYAFFGCTGLTSITIPENVTSIGNYAFMGCTGLTSATIGNSVDSIGSYAFQGCSSLTSITISENVTSMGYGAFANCRNLQTVNYNAMNCTSSNSLFYGDTAFTTLHIGNRVKRIPNSIFPGCNKLTSVVIPDSITNIGYNAFGGCSGLVSVTIGNSVDSIGSSAFFRCIGLTSVTIPNSVTTIGSSAFSGCISLTSVTIPNSVTTISNYAFQNCSGLTTITSHAVTPPVYNEIYNPNIFQNVPSNIPVYIPCLTVNDYRNAAGWNYFTNYIVNGAATPDTTWYSVVRCYQTGYTDNNFTEPIHYAGVYYATLANSAGCDSVVCLTLTESPVQEICMISVDENDHNELVWKEHGAVAYYNIYREGIQSGQYELIATAPYGSGNTYTDTLSDAKMRSYRYYVSASDTCATQSAPSATHKTMHLTINQGTGNSWNLIWTPYEGISYSTYNIYRASGKNSSMQLIGALSGGNTSYSDFSAPAGYVYYMVEIVLDEPCVLTKSLSSIKSNIATNAPETAFVAVSDITGVPSSATAGIPLALLGTVTPGNATHRDIIWTVKDVGATSAYINGNMLHASSAGMVTATASIADGLAEGTNFAKDFSITIHPNVGISEHAQANILDIYPNPVQNTLYIETSSIINEVSIYDISGRMLKQIARPNQEINVSDLANGIYLVKVKTEWGEVIRKIVKE